MTYFTEEQLEEFGAAARRALDLNRVARLDVIEFLRRLKHRGYISDYLRVSEIVLPDAEAKYVATDRKILIRNSVYEAAVKGDERCRFTIVHEGSHVLLNHQFERKRSFGPNAASEMRVASIRRDEKQADKLAAIILAPFDQADFSPTTTIEDLKYQFGLSLPSAMLRHQEMGRLYRRIHGLSRPLPQGIIDFLAARRGEGHKVTSLPSSDLAAIQVRQVSYTGDLCSACNGIRLIRVGTHTQCNDCGAITGDG